MTAKDRAEVKELLHDVKRQPDEDRLRLILADWLEDHGDAADRARAELIRLQVRREEGLQDHARLRLLVAAHRREWLGPIATWDPRARFHRGLVRVSLLVGDLAARSLQAQAESEAWAWVEHVTLTSLTGPSRLIMTSAALADLSSFACAPSLFGPQFVQQLCRAEWLRSVRTLALSGQHLHLHDLEPLLVLGTLDNLRELDLSDNVMSPAVMELLARLKLRRLMLRRAGVGDAVAQALAQQEGFASLRDLDLSDNAVSLEGATALAGSPHLAGLESLTLFGNALNTEAVARLRDQFGERVHMAGK